MYSVNRVLRLFDRTQIHMLKKRLSQSQYNSGQNKANNVTKTRKDIKILVQENRDKIKFNSYLDNEKLQLGNFRYHLKAIKKAKAEVKTQYMERSLPPLPLSLRYVVDKDRLLKDEIIEPPIPDKHFHMPFGSSTNIDYQEGVNPSEEQISQKTVPEFDRSNIKKWMTNYEHFDDSKMADEEFDDDEIESDWYKNYGTPDPNMCVSHVPCGGCGALLHCSDPAIPGYLPSELYKGREKEELQSMECQRCHFLKEYNIALDVNVSPDEYERLLQSIRHVKSLVLLIVDLLDFPCSIWPGIVDIIGTERPLIIVGNKVDLLPGDSFGYLKRIKEAFVTEINKTKLGEANIKHISLISAKTGFGVEELISNMFKIWLYKGDVFLVGCTNVGKSSLFNTLLQSDYCKVHAVDIIKRATVSRWPGTTLNLLKFPINRPSGWKIYERNRRLKSQAELTKVEKEIKNVQLNKKDISEAPALIGHIGRTFSKLDMTESGWAEKKLIEFDEKHEVFAKSKWLYDTPGVVHPDQVLSLLSTEELLVTIPKTLIRPQTYYLHVGSSLFIGGLARMDFVECTEPCRFTVFCSEHLPITVTLTEDADEMYEKLLGTELFAAPSGGEERLKSWPGLQKHHELLEFVGEGPKLCCGDIVLSSVAWVSVTAKLRSICKVHAWTPHGRGIYRRYPSILPFSINLKGKRLQETPAYMVGNVFSEED